MPHLTPGPCLGLAGALAILEACRGAGGERPRLAPHDLTSGSVQSANLRSSDYQDPLPNNAGHAQTVRLASSDTP